METALVCRLCLKIQNPGEYANMSETSEEGSRILKMLISCFPDWDRTVVADPVICLKCKKRLNDAYRFRKQCLRTENKLKSYTTKYSNAKVDLLAFVCSNDSNNNTDLKTIDSTERPGTSRKKFSVYRKRYTCEDCFGCKNRIFDVRYHQGPSEDACICSMCGNIFTKKDLRRHIYSHIYLMECDVCHKRCRDKTTLEVHLRSHTKEKPFECPVCAKKFAQSYALNMHMGKHSNTDNGTKCEMCEKVLSTRYNLKIHMMSHDVSKKLSCSNCNRCFYTAGAFDKHSCGPPLKKKRITCPSCRKWFFRQSALEKHLQVCRIDIKEEKFVPDLPELVVIKQEEQDDYFTEGEEPNQFMKLGLDFIVP